MIQIHDPESLWQQPSFSHSLSLSAGQSLTSKVRFLTSSGTPMHYYNLMPVAIMCRSCEGATQGLALRSVCAALYYFMHFSPAANAYMLSRPFLSAILKMSSYLGHVDMSFSKGPAQHLGLQLTLGSRSLRVQALLWISSAGRHAMLPARR